MATCTEEEGGREPKEHVDSDFSSPPSGSMLQPFTSLAGDAQLLFQIPGEYGRDPLVSSSSSSSHSPSPSQQQQLSPEVKAGRVRHPFARNNFFKSVEFSPDGLCLLSLSNDNRMRLYETSSLFDSAEQSGFEHGGGGATPPPSPPDPALTMKEPGTVYDLAWYPLMTSSVPSTCCFLSTCHKNPTHLWDAFTGKLRATYRSYDYADEITAALSVAFSGNGDKIICGFDRHIRIFDVGYPGRDYETRALIKTVGGRRGQKRRKIGQRGLISCIDTTSLYGGLYACGSYAGSTFVYEEKSGKTVCSLDAHQNGVTKVKFAPDASRLWTGGRRDDVIIEWDLRMLKILRRYERRCGSNQRFSFDISPNDGGRFLLTGSQNGELFIYDTLRPPASSPTPTPTAVATTAAGGTASNPGREVESDPGDAGDYDDDAKVAVEAREKPVLRFKGPGDAVNSVSFHPSFSQQFPYFAACTGERKFWLDVFDEDDDEEEEDDDRKHNGGDATHSSTKKSSLRPTARNVLAMYSLSAETTS